MPSNPLRKILDRRAKETGNSSEEALEKLARGIEETRQVVQRQNEGLARGYFEDSIGALKQQLQDSRATLEGLPEQIPGGEEESFEALIGKLTESYARIEEALDEATENAASVDAEAPDGSEAQDADGRETEETGSEEDATEGAVPDAVAEDVGEIDEDAVEEEEEEEEEVGAAEGAVGGEVVDAEGPTEASDAGEREGDKLGVELPELAGTRFSGAIAVGGVTEQAGGVAEGAPDRALEIIGGAALNGGEASQGEGQGVGGSEGAADEPKATNAARRRAQELGLDLKNIRGSGVNGLITIQDVVKL